MYRYALNELLSVCSHHITKHIYRPIRRYRLTVPGPVVVYSLISKFTRIFKLTVYRDNSCEE